MLSCALGVRLGSAESPTSPAKPVVAVHDTNDAAWLRAYGTLIFHDTFEREETGNGAKAIGNGWNSATADRVPQIKMADLDNGILKIASATKDAAHTADASARAWRIMPVGDSITEGGATFSNYRSLLAEKLRAARIAFEFVGTRGTAALRHEGYGGKNVEFLATTVPALFAANPADIVLLHAGHNHFAEEQPIPGMLAATERLIASFRATNPKVIMLLAQVIPAGKLPKYSYIPELNAELARLASRLHTPAQPVRLVDQATGFDWRTDTIADLVHPNTTGAAKMAARWLEAVQSLPFPPR